jgi:hypothetical protein
MSQLEQFMAAIRSVESGGNYNALGPKHKTMGHARGAYQIMASNWEPWAREAGLAGADWRDPRAQDAVARHKFSQYYRQFGDWRLVAVAWFAGPGRAKKAMERGIESVGGLSDSLGTSVSGYVSKVMGRMGQGGSPDAMDRNIGVLDVNAPAGGEVVAEAEESNDEYRMTLAAVLDSMSASIATRPEKFADMYAGFSEPGDEEVV